MYQPARQSHITIPTVFTALAAATLLITPFLMVPVLTNFPQSSKLLLLELVGSVFLALGVGVMIWKRMLSFHKSQLVTALLTFAITVTASSLLTNRYPIEHLLGMGGALLSFVSIVLFAGSWIKPHTKQLFAFVWFSSLLILAISTLLQTLGWGPSHLINQLVPVALPHTAYFNLAGSVFIAAQVFALGVFSGIVSLLKEKQTRVLALATTIVSIVGIALTTWYMLPGKAGVPTILPFGPSWTIAFETLKIPQRALIGAGPENYVSAYQLFRPISTNLGENWNLSFSQGVNVPLTLLTTLGILGFGAWVWVTIEALRLTQQQWRDQPVIAATVIGSITLQLLLPLNYVTLSIYALALAWLMANAQPRRQMLVHFFKVLEDSVTQHTSQGSRLWHVSSIIATAFILLLTLGALGRNALASFFFLQSSFAAQANNIDDAFALQAAATNVNPYLAFYQSNFAITNAQLATAIASKKTELTSEEQQSISDLLQQSIQKGRDVTTLRPDDSQSWAVLAEVYRNLVPFTGEDNTSAIQWTIASYAEAINRNPLDPQLRLQLGNFLLNVDQQPDAIAVFQQAVQLKPDFAAAQYGLATALRVNGKYAEAKGAYTNVLTLLQPDSAEFAQVQKELTEVEKLIPTEETTSEPAAGATPSTPTISSSPNATTSALPSLPSVLEQNLPTPTGNDLENQNSVLNTSAAPSPAAAPLTTPFDRE